MMKNKKNGASIGGNLHHPGSHPSFGCAGLSILVDGLRILLRRRSAHPVVIPMLVTGKAAKAVPS